MFWLTWRCWTDEKLEGTETGGFDSTVAEVDD